MRTASHSFPLLALSLAAAAGCAQTEAPEMAGAAGRQCFRPQQVNGFNPQGDDVVYLRVGARDVYRAEILGTCSDIDFAHRVAIRSRGTSWICQGMDAEFVVPGPRGIESCPITDIRKLNEAEVEAYRRSR